MQDRLIQDQTLARNTSLHPKFILLLASISHRRYHLIYAEALGDAADCVDCHQQCCAMRFRGSMQRADQGPRLLRSLGGHQCAVLRSRSRANRSYSAGGVKSSGHCFRCRLRGVPHCGPGRSKLSGRGLRMPTGRPICWARKLRPSKSLLAACWHSRVVTRIASLVGRMDLRNWGAVYGLRRSSRADAFLFPASLWRCCRA
jgi:hypothetical protein